MDDLKDILTGPDRIRVHGAPGAFPAFWLAERVRSGEIGATIHVAIDDRDAERTMEALCLLVPGARILMFPAWDCLPYDRVGPNGAIAARRVDTLYQLARAGEATGDAPIVVVTTVNAALQRVPAPETYAEAGLRMERGGSFDLEHLATEGARAGYSRVDTVLEPGEYAVRGGIVDIFPAGEPQPVRLDLFGDEIEKIRRFDPLTQISAEEVDAVTLKPISETILDEDRIARFRSRYRELFGAARHGDILYEAISEGRRVPGMEHWLPLFHERLVCLFDYLPGAAVSLAPGIDDAGEMRLEQIADYYRARADLARAGGDGDEEIYNPLPADQLYLDAGDWADALAGHAVIAFDDFAAPGDGRRVLDAGARLMRDFAAEAHAQSANPFDLAIALVRDELGHGRRVVLAGASAGSSARLNRLLTEHGLRNLHPCATWHEVDALGPGDVALVTLDIGKGFTSPGLTVIAEPDLLGRRLARPGRRQRPADAFLSEISALDHGDLVVHAEHGIGRYDGLETLLVPPAEGTRPVRHDCMRILYGGGDKLFVPVENIDVLTRYGEDQGNVSLDRLGGAAWQARKSRLRNRIREMAGELLKVAAARTLAHAPRLEPPAGSFEEFCARFPYAETEDQQTAIADTLTDLAADRPMDRLICGDVGFGKTEVALRAAFAAAMSGVQVAVVVPTTLLARQHFETFRTRFEGFPVEIAQISRLVQPKEAEAVKEGLRKGTVDIVIGTHALLAERVAFANLGLLVIDEEQHFGVVHKERLKKLRASVHVLTLTATPIPRTLQLALTGVKELSIIASPPPDRLAVRTFISPFDPLVVREAIRRELHRGGQCFYVCPRIGDIGAVMAELKEIAPEARVRSVHGQMPAAKIEPLMASFLDGAFDVLVSTNIIESGLDMPNVNTIVIHRADMFGLGQLYQLRGRVGRSRVRAYAYLTLPPRRTLTSAAAKRLHVMQTLDNLGAGFSLASHDLDIRGAGNLLGEEQSGHIREVGIELYQHMLEETVAELKGQPPSEAEFSPQINLDIPVLIPESYVTDLGLRLGLYRRIAAIASAEDVEAFAAELIDRFGPLPEEVENLLSVVALKQDCRAAGIERVEAGRRGCLISFHKDHFANPAGLVDLLAGAAGTMKLRPDHTLVVRRDWPGPQDRIKGLGGELRTLAGLAAAASP